MSTHRNAHRVAPAVQGRQFDGFASGYAMARPGYPPALWERLLRRHGRRFAIACDLGCGTGQSLVGLRPLADHVIGLDPSALMLQEARRRCPWTEMRLASAEATGLAPESVDLVTIATAFHWMDATRVIAEAERVLRPSGLFAAYRYDIPTVDEHPGRVFQSLLDTDWAPHIPPQLRQPADPYDWLVASSGWREVQRAVLPYAITYSPPAFVEMIFATSYVQGYLKTVADPVAYRRELVEAFATDESSSIVAHFDIKITDGLRHG